jgi:glutamate dehydrogenase/leucine dehydrogenase
MAWVMDTYSMHVGHTTTAIVTGKPIELGGSAGRRGIFVVPDILGDSGGVTVWYFEWVQNRYGYFWREQEVNERLESKLCEAFRAVLSMALRFRVNTRTAAYMVTIERVAAVTRLRGMYA